MVVVRHRARSDAKRDRLRHGVNPRWATRHVITSRPTSSFCAAEALSKGKGKGKRKREERRRPTPCSLFPLPCSLWRYDGTFTQERAIRRPEAAGESAPDECTRREEGDQNLVSALDHLSRLHRPYDAGP